MNPRKVLTFSCGCGRVRFGAEGKPIATVVCYCDDCQAGSRVLAALPGAAPVDEEDGGTAYVMLRKDRVRCTSGDALLADHKLDEGSATSRVVATCCNAAMMMRFDDARHWTSIYRARFGDDRPPLQWRICTRFKRDGVRIPADVPGANMYPAALMLRLLASGIASRLRIGR